MNLKLMRQGKRTISDISMKERRKASLGRFFSVENDMLVGTMIGKKTTRGLLR